MSRLLYITNASLDGYIEDAAGAFDWENPDQLHAPVIELLQPVGTYLYGRRLYEKMSYWDGSIEAYPAAHRDFARLWQTAEKIVFSRTLANPTTRRTRIEPEFELESIRKLKRESERDITIGGAELAAIAIEAGLVDDFHLLIHPAILGGGKPAFATTTRRNLDLVAVRRIGTGVAHLHYRLRA